MVGAQFAQVHSAGCDPTCCGFLVDGFLKGLHLPFSSPCAPTQRQGKERWQQD